MSKIAFERSNGDNVTLRNPVYSYKARLPVGPSLAENPPKRRYTAWCTWPGMHGNSPVRFQVPALPCIGLISSTTVMLGSLRIAQNHFKEPNPSPRPRHSRDPMVRGSCRAFGKFAVTGMKAGEIEGLRTCYGLAAKCHALAAILISG